MLSKSRVDGDTVSAIDLKKKSEKRQNVTRLLYNAQIQVYL